MQPGWTRESALYANPISVPLWRRTSISRMMRVSWIGPSPEAMSDLPEPHDHHPWTTPAPCPRPTTRMHLGATRSMSSVRQDLHHLARLAGAVGAFQLVLPAGSL
jgi:hypothetical protein